MLRPLLIFTTLACAAIITACASPQSAAYAACTESVARKLVSPATAKWSDPNEETTAGDNASYMFLGHVDSQNSFGATVRSGFTCIINRDSAGTWQADSVVVWPYTGV